MLTIGAVAYDPKVVTIWEGFCAWLAREGLPTDYVLYQNYEQQVDAHLGGGCDVAWNSPLAWIEAERKAQRAGRAAYAFAMRDTDQDLTSVVLVRADGPHRALSDLAGRRVAVGAADSPQATLIPLGMFHAAGVPVEPVVFDVLPGKHGDHVGGERDAVKALVAGQVDAACLIDGNQLVFSRDGTLPTGTTRVLARSEPYDHCVFTGIRGHKDPEVGRFSALLQAMRWEDPVVRPLLELEGLREWRPGRVVGFGALNRAIDALGFAGAAAVRAFCGR